MRLVVVNSHRGGREFDDNDAIESEAQLEEVRAALREAGVEHEVRQLVRGLDPADDLVNVAAEVNADIIVIGLRRRSPVGKLILGSNAQRVLLDAPCPVLAVKAGE
jgi:nucleotide-binding universal stress UspA family protein